MRLLIPLGAITAGIIIVLLMLATASSQSAVSYTNFDNQIPLGVFGREKFSPYINDDGMMVGVYGIGSGYETNQRIVTSVENGGSLQTHFQSVVVEPGGNEDGQIVEGGGVIYMIDEDEQPPTDIDVYQQRHFGDFTEWDAVCTYANAGSPVFRFDQGIWHFFYEDVNPGESTLYTSGPDICNLPYPGTVVYQGNAPDTVIVPDSVIHDGTQWRLYVHSKSGDNYPCHVGTAPSLGGPWSWLEPVTGLPPDETSCVVYEVDGQPYMFSWNINSRQLSRWTGVQPPLPTPTPVPGTPVFEWTGPQTFNGTNEYIDTGFVGALDNFTIETRVSSPASPGNNGVNSVWGRETVHITWDHVPGAEGRVWIEVGGTWYDATFGTLLPNIEYTLKATYDGQVLRSYVFGNLVDENFAPSGPVDPDGLSGHIARHPENGCPGGCFEGTIHYVKIWDEVQ